MCTHSHTHETVLIINNTRQQPHRSGLNRPLSLLPPPPPCDEYQFSTHTPATPIPPPWLYQQHQYVSQSNSEFKISPNILGESPHLTEYKKHLTEYRNRCMAQHKKTSLSQSCIQHSKGIFFYTSQPRRRYM